MKYTFRKSILTKPTSYELTEDALKISSEESRREIPYSNIKSIRLHYNPTRVNPNQFECNIGLGSETITILNMSFLGVGDFEDKSLEYSEFVKGLHQKLENYTDVKFTGGISWTKYIFYALMNIVVLWLVISVLFSMGVPSGLVVVKLLLFGFLLYLGYFYYKRNKPVTYNATEIPEKLLPSEK